jgi:anti-sigma regulatory factor (Ser/Thr protein kinase)
VTTAYQEEVMERTPEQEAAVAEITRPAAPDSIGALVEFVVTHAREAAFDEQRVAGIGRATEEALLNIIRFACPKGTEEVRISCTFHDSGSLIVNIVDTGVPFNMLLAGTFSETEDFFEPGKEPTTKIMKKVIKNIEYRRGSAVNTLVFTISPMARQK